MLAARSRNGIPIRLPEERWRHIVSGHPEMSDLQTPSLETLAQPDMIQLGDSGELLAVRAWSEPPLSGRHLVVAYREIGPEDGFDLTAYVTRRPSARRVTLWKR